MDEQDSTTVCEECGVEIFIVDLNTCAGCDIEACEECVGQHICELRTGREEDHDNDGAHE